MVQKWKDEFIQMLMLFPLAAIVFGGSQFAAGVIISQNTHDWFNHLIAIIIVTMPLFSLPFLAKNSGKIVGAAGKALTDLANKAKSPMTKWTGERADRAKDRANNAAMNGSDNNPYKLARRTYLRGKAKRDYAAQTQKGEFSRSQSKFIADEVESNDKYRKNLAKGSGDGADMRAKAAAINIQAELEVKEVKAASAVIEHMDLSVPQKKALARGEEVKDTNGNIIISGKDESVREAAIMSAVAAGTVGDVEDIIQSSGRDVMNADGTVKTKGMTKRQRHALVSSMISSGIPAKATHLGGQTLGDIEQGNLDWEMVDNPADPGGDKIRGAARSIEDGLDSVTVRAINTGKYSAEKVAGNEVNSLERVEKVLSGNTRVPRPDVDKSSKIIDQIKKARDDPRIGSTITEGQRTVIDRILPRPQADNEDGAGI